MKRLKLEWIAMMTKLSHMAAKEELREYVTEANEVEAPQTETPRIGVLTRREIDELEMIRSFKGE